MALVWAAPYALLVSELASALPAEGGISQWFRAGLGPFWSFQFSFMDWTTWVLDAALYPPLVASFVGTLFVREPSHWFRWTLDRKSTRLNSSHGYISYAVFCLKKKNKTRCATRVSIRSCNSV